MRYESLQETQTEIEALELNVREMRNIIALQQWSGGNAAYLTRKLNILSSVLDQLEELLSFDEEPGDLLEQIPGSDTGNMAHRRLEESEAYPSFIATFGTWLMDVQHLWTDRDDAEAGSTQDFDRFRTVEGVGETFKTSLRNFTSHISQLVLRLEDLRQTDRTRSPERLRTPRQKPVDEKEDDSNDEANVFLLTKLVSGLVSGMHEELQIIREIEFEIMEGERAWLTARERESAWC